MVRLAAALLPLPFLAGCLTISLVSEAEEKTYHKARLTDIRAASLAGATVMLQVSVRSPIGLDSNDLLFRVPVSSIGKSDKTAGQGSYGVGDLPTDPRPLVCYERGDVLPADIARLPIRRIDVRDETALDEVLEALPVGIHVLAVRFDPHLEKSPRERGVSDQVSLDRNTTPVLVRRLEGEAPRRLMVYGFQVETKGRGALYLLTPFSAVGDILTFPFQLIAALTIEC
jgi:hypothetical protein